MKCPTCESDATAGLTMTTLMGHSPGAPDPNWKTTYYECPHGHSFAVKRRDGESDHIILNADPPRVRHWTDNVPDHAIQRNSGKEVP